MRLRLHVDMSCTHRFPLHVTVDSLHRRLQDLCNVPGRHDHVFDLAMLAPSGCPHVILSQRHDGRRHCARAAVICHELSALIHMCTRGTVSTSDVPYSTSNGIINPQGKGNFRIRASQISVRRNCRSMKRLRQSVAFRKTHESIKHA